MAKSLKIEEFRMRVREKLAAMMPGEPLVRLLERPSGGFPRKESVGGSGPR